MLGELIVFFPHRRNKDGSFDSICLSCLATVARTNTEAELAEHDRSHICTRLRPKIYSAPRTMSNYKKLSFDTRSPHLSEKMFTKNKARQTPLRRSTDGERFLATSQEIPPPII